jgi:hypothetical protein
MIRAAPGAAFEAYVSVFPSGLAGTLGVRIRDGAGGDFLARTTAGIAEDVTVGIQAVYRRSFEAPLEAGQYWLVWDDGAELSLEELLVTSSQAAVGLPNARDLCELADVLRYVPGYETEEATDETLQAQITAESRRIHRTTGREFVAIAGLDPRLFEIGRKELGNRRIRIGDATEIETVRILRDDATTPVAELDPGVYAAQPYVREEWEPIRELKLLQAAPTPSYGQLLEVSAVWGYPSIPEDIREACAKLVIVRYLTDIAFRGTALSDALGESEINVGGLLVSAREAIANHGTPEVA